MHEAIQDFSEWPHASLSFYGIFGRQSRVEGALSLSYEAWWANIIRPNIYRWFMKQVSRVLKLFSLSLFLLVFFTPILTPASIKQVPFQEGERLLYRAKWGAVSAGEAVIETLPLQMVQGRKSYHFALTAWSNPRLDSFFRVRERQDSFTNLELTHTLRYSKRGTGHRTRDVVVNFDWQNMTATSINSGKPQKPVSIFPGTLDPLAVIFSIRAKRLEVGDVFEIPVTDGKKCVSLRAAVTGRETLVIDDRSYDTFVVLPDMESLSGFLKKGRQIKLWYSADEQQVPVRMQSRFPIGNFVFELVTTES